MTFANLISSRVAILHATIDPFIRKGYFIYLNNFMYILLIIIVAVVVWLVWAYNNFIRKVNRSKEALADIDVQLKRRYDLIPNLINTVKGYAAHESGTLEKVVQARASAMQATAPAEKAEAEKTLASSLKSVFAISEAYPDLKANQNFLALQAELSDTENKIQAARRFYNANVRDLNTAVGSFPGNFIAKQFKFTQMDLFDLEANDVARQNVEVKF